MRGKRRPVEYWSTSGKPFQYVWVCSPINRLDQQLLGSISFVLSIYETFRDSRIESWSDNFSSNIKKFRFGSIIFYLSQTFYFIGDRFTVRLYLFLRVWIHHIFHEIQAACNCPYIHVYSVEDLLVGMSYRTCTDLPHWRHIHVTLKLSDKIGFTKAYKS